MNSLKLELPMKSFDVELVDEKKGILKISYDVKVIEGTIGEAIMKLLQKSNAPVIT